MTALDLNALMNMRGAGNAQKELIKAKEWTPFLTDEERMDWLNDVRVKAKDPLDKITLFHHKPDMLTAPDIRATIDAAALKQGTLL